MLHVTTAVDWTITLLISRIVVRVADSETDSTTVVKCLVLVPESLRRVLVRYWVMEVLISFGDVLVT